MIPLLHGAARAIALCAALLFGPSATAETETGRPAIWRVADEDSTVWIFGSVHALPPEIDWRSPELERALAEAEVVYFEISGAPETELELMARITAAGFDRDGVALSSRLSPDGRERYFRVVDGFGLPPATLEPMKPWLAAWFIGALVSETEGARAAAGVDSALRADAIAAGKELRHFETIDDAMVYLSDYAEEDQIALLEETLRQVEERPQITSALIAAWRTGDLDTLERLVFGAIENTPDIFYERLFRDRNMDWSDEIDSFMQGSGDALVVVGAGHMLGPDSLLLMLEARGRVVERY